MVQGPLGFEATHALVGSLHLAIAFTGPTLTVQLSDVQLCVRPVPVAPASRTSADSGTLCAVKCARIAPLKLKTALSA